MVDIQSPTAENRRGKEEERKKEKETIEAEYNGSSMLGGHNKILKGANQAII